MGHPGGVALYHQLKGEDCADALKATCDRLERENAPRVARAMRNLSLYEGRPIRSLTAGAYLATCVSDEDEQRFNLARNIANAAVAKVGGKQRPKSQFCVSSSDWSVKRRAKRMERVVEATMLQRQSATHHDAWSVGMMMLRDAAVLDMGAIRWDVDYESCRVSCRRVFPLELLVDANEAKYGDPRNIFHVYGYDRHLLCAKYPEHEKSIMQAPSYEDEARSDVSFDGNGDRARMVKVREAWRLPSGTNGSRGYKAGRHVMAVGDADLLDGETFDRDFFPIEMLTWEPWFLGIHGTSIVDNVAGLHIELNAAVERWAASERLASNMMIFFEANSVATEQISSNLPATLVEVRHGAQMPVAHAPETIGQASIAWQDRLKAGAYEQSGQSQMGATGQVDQGVTAGIAMRTIDNIATERFSWQWQQFERVMAIGSARQIVAAHRELAEYHGDEGYSVRCPGASYLSEIKWSEADLEDDKYVIQVYAVSGLVNTPTDRLNLASDLMQMGVITRDAFLRIIQYKNVDEEIAGSSRQNELLEQMMESWMDADVERLRDGDRDYFNEIYWPPEPFLQLEEAMIQVGNAYFSARLERAPDEILELFVRYMGEIDAQIKKQAAMQAQAQGPAAIGSGPMPAPGAVPAGVING